MVDVVWALTVCFEIGGSGRFLMVGSVLFSVMNE